MTREQGNAAFDRVAGEYDSTFTDTQTGRLQRRQVHRYLEQEFGGKHLRILELNCGTGEDALWLAEQGHEVLATDISGEMVAVAAKKAGTRPGLAFRQASIDAALQLEKEAFDLVFSNFGGLNCLSPEALRAAAKAAAGTLRPDGRMVAVIMPRYCAWESIYYMAKFRFRSAFRRSRMGPLQVPLGNGAYQATWYHSPKALKRIFSPEFSFVAQAPIGFALPPSYLDPFFSRRPRLMRFLEKTEKRSTRKSMLAGLSDHYLVDFRRPS